MEQHFTAFARAHAEALRTLDALETRTSGAADAELLAVVDELLAFHDGVLAPLFAREEAEVYVAVRHSLPGETAAAFLREHATLRGLARQLRAGRAGLRSGKPDAQGTVLATVTDLALLLREHLRKEDRVLVPLVERLLDAENEARH